MKTILREAIIILLLIIFGITGVNAQILVSENFENVTEPIPTNWEVAYGDENYPFDLSTVEELGSLGLSCSGDKAFLTALESNMIPSSFIITPSYTNGNSDPVVVSFKFKVLGYPDFEPITFDFGSINTFYSTNGGTSWTELGNINNTNFNSTAICSTTNYVIPENILSASSEFKLKWEMNCTTGFIMIVIDDLSILQTALCQPPIDLTATNITTSSATLEWQSDGEVFDIEYGLAGFTLGEGIIISGVDNSYILSGLTPGVNYQYYVRRDCGSGNESFWIGPLGFTTLCDPVDLFTEDFDSYNTGNIVPDCWSRIIFGTGIQEIVSTVPTASGNRQIHQQSSNPSNSSVVILPKVNNIDAGTHWLRFKARVSSGTGILQVGYVTDITDASTFVEIVSLSITNTEYGLDESEYIIPFFSDTPSNARIAIRNPGLSNASHFWDDVYWEAATSCIHPLGLSAVNISQSSTVLNWNSDGIFFDIEYGLQGFIQGAGTTILGISNPYTLEGLINGTTYEYYVRQNCGMDGISDWSIPLTFTAGIYQGNIPTMLNTNPSVEDDACAALFSIEVPDGQQISSINVQYTMTSSSPALDSHQRSVLYSSTLGMGEAQVVSPSNPQNYPGVIYYNRPVTFANGATGTVEFELKAWRTEGGTGCSTDRVYVENGTWVLNATFEDIPSCPNPPVDLGYGNITADAVDLIWSSDETGTFQMKWGIVGFDDDEDDEGTTVSDINGFTHTLSGLDSSIPYEYYVRRDCSINEEPDFGQWVGPVRFNSGHCIPYATQGTYFTLFNTTNATENVTYSFPSGSPTGPGYINTNLTITQNAGETFNFTSNYVGGASGLKIWVDWNNDFIFTDDEQIYYVASTNGNKSGTITIPENTINGDYRMRVRAQSGATSTPSACGLIDQGEALDFTLKVQGEASVSDFNSFGFKYYPNPVSDLLYFSANTPISDVTVINMLGQQVNVPVNSDNTNLDISGLPTGNYLIKVTIEGVSKTLKIVKK